MADPAANLPPLLTSTQLLAFTTSLNLPPPTHTEPLTVTAAFHSIYLLHFPPSAYPNLAPARPNADGTITLVLRVAGPHLPRIKTENEVAVMRWVRQHTSVPVPAVLRWDSSCENVLGCEFTLLERVEGVSADKVFWELGESERRRLIEQLLVGGLRVDDKGEIVPGPVVDEWFWMEPEISRCWDGETTETLNPVGGAFSGWAEHLDKSVEKYVYAIGRHPSLEWMRDLVPRLEAYREYIRVHADEVDDTRYVLSHRDLHLANVMVDGEGNVTGILDWEFGGVVPGPRWDPPNAFLYPWGGEDDEIVAKAERERMRGWAREVCLEKGIEGEVVAGWPYKGIQETVQKVVNFTRAICEVCPRGQEEKARVWRVSLESELTRLGL
ncbi:phosphotransferase enzyme family-domain-containing protein [Colletotrichum acutatum]|uniref:Phosphotransferase enzyme family-domain-containing protein n=1 Tax=Glomerella acutata TaxID=27357 RepID=A0AAD8U9A0_GLOAC|nr:phosphotransferase enzyme family-domain-containing protein [Colletotrichum acutatum]KAK1713798.1 phosphotransferase enzyme family-domain-containing protein [Colletotrichum acutatum]